MHPTQAKEHHVVAPPPAPCPVSLSGSPVRVRRDDGTGEARGALGRGAGEAARAEADVPAAAGRVLDRFPADRVARAQAMDALSAGELAGRAARFSRSGGARRRLLWWTVRACAGTGRMPAAAALRTGATLERPRTCAPVHDDVRDGPAPRRGRPALHAGLCAPAVRAACPRSGRYPVERSRALGAALAGADHAAIRALYPAGRRVGVAFRLRDDLEQPCAGPSPLARSGARETAR
ncbi:hypothetical protein ABZV75_19700 [Streptomyces flaveolus]|uniref:hypothetical protein n=1 Tax=Streptomyces flaveolus TaxID=67297 RepID=UPI0033BA3622